MSSRGSFSERHPRRPVPLAVDGVVFHRFAHPLPLPPNAKAHREPPQCTLSGLAEPQHGGDAVARVG